MKALAWIKFFETQRQRHGKVLFRVAELANVARRDPHALNVELGRLVKKGVIRRYAWGVYGLPSGVTPEDLVPMLDDDAYITGLYALHRHHLVTQQPTEITAFTRRRHAQSKERETAMGRVIFVTVNKRVYARPKQGVLASPEQALCDFIYILRRRGLDPASLVTFRNLNNLSRKELQSILDRYPATTATTVHALLG